MFILKLNQYLETSIYTKQEKFIKYTFQTMKYLGNKCLLPDAHNTVRLHLYQSKFKINYQLNKIQFVIM